MRRIALGADLFPVVVGFFVVLRDAFTFGVNDAEVAQGVAVALSSGFFKPGARFIEVLFATFAVVVVEGEDALCFGMPRSAPGCTSRVLWRGLARRQGRRYRAGLAGLCGGVALRGGLFAPFACSGVVLRDAEAAEVEEAKLILCFRIVIGRRLFPTTAALSRSPARRRRLVA